MCKYPEKTRRRKLELSSDELVSSRVAMPQQQAITADGDDVKLRYRAAANRDAHRTNIPRSAGTSHDGRKFNHGSDDDSDVDIGPAIPSTGSRTRGVASSSRADTRKRPGDTDQGGGYARGTTKKPKFLHPPLQLGMCE